MLSKLATVSAIIGAASADSGRDRELLSLVAGHHRPLVKSAGCDAAADFAVKRLKKGPADIVGALKSYTDNGTKFTDTEFAGKDVLYKAEFGASH